MARASFEPALNDPGVTQAVQDVFDTANPPPPPHPMAQFGSALLAPAMAYGQQQDAPPSGAQLGITAQEASGALGLNNYQSPLQQFVGGMAAPFVNDVKGKLADFGSFTGLGPQSDYFNSPEASQNAQSMMQWTKAGSGGLADVHVPGQAVGVAKDVAGALPQLARDEAGMARIDLGLLGPDAGSSGGGLNQRIAAAQAAKNPSAAANEALVAAKGEVAVADTGGALAPPVPDPPPSPERPPNLGVNLDKIEAPQPVKDLIEQTAVDNAGFEAQRRGVVSVEETMADAAKMQVDISKYAHIKPGTAMNAEELKATFGAMVSKGEEVVALQEQVRAAAAVGVKSDELNLRLILASTEHQSIQRVFAGARAESGRALRIQREISGALNAGTGSAYDKAIEAIGGREKAGALVDRLQKIWTDPALDATTREMATYKFIQHLDSPKFFDRLNSLWINAILSSPVTHAVNVTGQAILFETDIARKLGAAGVESVTTVGGKVRPREVFFTQAMAEQYGAIASLGDGFKRGLTMLRTGVSPEAMTKFAETGQIGNREVNAGFLNPSLRALGAEDQVFYASGYGKGLYGSAAQIASRERQGFLSGDWARRVSDLLATPTDEMLTAAEAAGKRAGLRTDAGVGAILKLRDMGVNVGPLGKFQPLRYVIPFVNTPTLLVKIGAEYSPLGFIGAVRGATGAARSEALAGALMGSTAMAFLASKYAEGNITGSAPVTPAERDAFYASGKIPYAVRIGNEWVSFNRLEPVATPLKWTAQLLDAAQNNQGQPIDVVATKMVGALGKSLTDATYLSGFSALIDAINDPERSASKFLAQIVGGFVPAAVRAGTQASDPFIRQPNGIIEQIESTFPGLNQNVPTKTNVYGEPVTRSQGKQGISGVLSPVDFNPAGGPDPVTEKVNSYSLPEMAGQAGVKDLQIGYVSKEIASYRLNTDEAGRYQQYAGQATHNLLEALFADKRPYDDQPFSKLAQVDQIRAIRKTIDDARTVGRAQVADEVVAAAKTPTDVSRGADMRLSTLSSRKDKAYYLEGLSVQGKLTGEVKSYLDAHAAKDDPPVAEFVKAAPLVREYLAIPPYVIGNEQEWTQLAAAKKEMTAFLKATPPPPGWTQLDWFQSKNPEPGVLIRRYSYDIVQNPKRAALLKTNPFVKSYLP